MKKILIGLLFLVFIGIQAVKNEQSYTEETERSQKPNLPFGWQYMLSNHDLQRLGRVNTIMKAYKIPRRHKEKAFTTLVNIFEDCNKSHPFSNDVKKCVKLKVKDRSNKAKKKLKPYIPPTPHISPTPRHYCFKREFWAAANKFVQHLNRHNIDRGHDSLKSRLSPLNES